MTRDDAQTLTDDARSFLQHPLWVHLKEQLEEEIRGRTQNILGIPQVGVVDGMMHALAAEYNKGYVAALQAQLVAPQVVLDFANGILDEEQEDG